MRAKFSSFTDCFQSHNDYKVSHGMTPNKEIQEVMKLWEHVEVLPTFFSRKHSEWRNEFLRIFCCIHTHNTLMVSDREKILRQKLFV